MTMSLLFCRMVVEGWDRDTVSIEAEKGGASNKVIAVLPPKSNERITRQDGAFTLHSRNGPLESLVEARQFLRKLVIPKDRKQGIAAALSSLGITRTNLFPDLDNLARVIKESTKSKYL
jgi:hypothetical protein